MPLNFNHFYSSTNHFFLSLALFMNLITLHSRLYFPKMVTSHMLFCDVSLVCLHQEMESIFSISLNLGETFISWAIKYSRVTLLRYRLSWPGTSISCFLENFLLGCPLWEPMCICHSMKSPCHTFDSLYPLLPCFQYFTIRKNGVHNIFMNAVFKIFIYLIQIINWC